MKNTYYITTAIPYVNAKPHLGHVLEWFQADALARYQRQLGKDVAFAAGSDENSLKNVQAAEKAGMSTQAWLDEYAVIFQEAFKTFNISLSSFRRGSDVNVHWPGVQDLWNRCEAAGDLYKKSYEGWYCIGCESFYTLDELVDGKCPEHLVEPEKVVEENWFFKLSKYQDQIKELILSNKLRIVSDQFRNEMLGFIEQGLEDFSISRSVARARGIGVPVPNDPSQVMYVWFDALSIYLTAIGWGFDNDTWQKYWPANVHVIGKGINRFHSIYWIGILLSAGLPTPEAISVHGYITANGQKMSKSLGNVIDPFTLIQQYDLEAVRLYLLKEIPTHSDGDFSYERFEEIYTADLSNGLGNLCSRVAKLCEKNHLDVSEIDRAQSFDPAFQTLMDNYELDQAAKWIWQHIAQLDGYLSEHKPWELSGQAQAEVLRHAVKQILMIAYHLYPFMPEMSTTIADHFHQPQISALSPLFPRLS